MDDIIRRGQVYQILALNDQMLKNGCISRQEHDFIQHLQAQKLTKLGRHGTMEP